jgi:hypothetical protein
MVGCSVFRSAEMERELIRERTLDGLRAARAQGRRGGRPPIVHEDTLTIARARQAIGESVTSIVRHLKIGRFTLSTAHSRTRTSAPPPVPPQAQTTSPARRRPATARATPRQSHRTKRHHPTRTDRTTPEPGPAHATLPGLAGLFPSLVPMCRLRGAVRYVPEKRTCLDAKNGIV